MLSADSLNKSFSAFLVSHASQVLGTLLASLASSYSGSSSSVVGSDASSPGGSDSSDSSSLFSLSLLEGAHVVEEREVAERSSALLQGLLGLSGSSSNLFPNLGSGLRFHHLLVSLTCFTSVFFLGFLIFLSLHGGFLEGV